MTTRQEAAAATRRKLIETAGELVGRHGFANVTVDDIVKASGVARGTFYIYFKNKADVVREFSRLPFADLEKQMEAEKGPVLERVSTYVREFTRQLKVFGLPITQQWLRDVADPKSAPEPADNAKLRYDLDVLARLLRNGIERGELAGETPVERLADLITSQLYGQMTCWCLSGGTFSMESAADAYCTELLPALLAPYLTKKETEN